MKALISRLEALEEFVLAQAPAICKEIIIEKTQDLLVEVIFRSFGFLITLGGAILALILVQDNIDKYSTSGILGLVSFIIASDSVHFIQMLLTVKNCPKLVILRELKSMTRS